LAKARGFRSFACSKSHYFYGAAFCEKSVIAIRPTKKFCEIAVAPVSPSYCLQINADFAALLLRVKRRRRL
jgi:hypothetical protein